MKHGFIKAAAISPRVTVADTRGNAEKIIEACNIAAGRGVKLAVFPELSVTGATCGDLFLNATLLNGAENALFEIAGATASLDMAIVVGAPVRREGKLYNCAVAMYAGEILGVSPKKTVYSIAQMRSFSSAPEKCGTVKLGEMFYPFGANMLFYCEALHEFNFACEFEDGLYLCDSISTSHARAGATVICVLGSSGEAIGKAKSRRMQMAAHSAITHSAFVCAGAGYGESTTDCVFGGHHIIYENGKFLAESKPFEREAGECSITVSDVDVSMLTAERMKHREFTPIEVTAENYYSLSFDMPLEDNALDRNISASPFIPQDADECSRRCELVLDIQSHGLCKRIEHTNARTVVLGISGGLDSTLALLAAARAMDILKRPRTDIIAVTMPCFGTTKRTRTNAEKLCEKLGVTLKTVDIKESVKLHFADIGHDENNRNAVYENAQARERTQVLMDIANAENGLVIGTGDMSELALGWATYNGDHMSMYAVNASVPKTLVRKIVAYIADKCGDGELADILYDIVDTPVSPELLPHDSDGEISQKTEDLVGPYELHDFYMYWFLRHGFSPEKIAYIACHAFEGVYSEETVEKWMDVFMRRFFSQQFKRSCLPDSPKIGSVGVSPRGELALPSDASSVLWREW